MMRDYILPWSYGTGAKPLGSALHRLVDGESCLPPCADNMAVFGVAKGGSTKDVNEGVTTWWLPGGDRQSQVMLGG